MNVFYDTEFLEDGKTIELISIGLVREDGKELYLINKDMDVNRIFKDDWVRQNVIKGIFDELEFRFLMENGGRGRFDFTSDEFWYLIHQYGHTRKEIADRIVEFVGKNPIFYGFCVSYDHVVLCQLWGKMIDIPKGWRYYSRDLKQTADENDFDTSLIRHTKEHNALDDAKWNLKLYRQLLEIEI
jgi:hypothetical protein